MGFKTISDVFRQQDSGRAMSAFHALIKDAKDVLKLRIGIRDHTPHPKHYYEVSQTMFFKQFRESHPSLHISKKGF